MSPMLLFAAAILNQGRLISEAPINELLEGDGQSILYDITLKGEADTALANAQKRVTSQPWVQGLNATPDDGLIRWQVSVSDEAAAEEQLLGLILADNGIKVKNFGRKTRNLEEVFLQLVEKENSK